MYTHHVKMGDESAISDEKYLQLRTAYHEAGHVVAAEAEGCHVTNVAIRTIGKGGGLTKVQIAHLEVGTQCVIFAAGSVAESIFMGDCARRPTSEDLLKTLHGASSDIPSMIGVGATDDDIHKYMQIASDVVLGSWRRLDAVAMWLVVAGSLCSAELKDLGN